MLWKAFIILALTASCATTRRAPVPFEICRVNSIDLNKNPCANGDLKYELGIGDLHNYFAISEPMLHKIKEKLIRCEEK